MCALSLLPLDCSLINGITGLFFFLIELTVVARLSIYEMIISIWSDILGTAVHFA